MSKVFLSENSCQSNIPADLTAKHTSHEKEGNKQ